MFPAANEAFSHFFEKLGYEVTYEGKIATGERWYEIYDHRGLLFQISMPPPSIAELVADLPHLIEGRSTTGPANYWLNTGPTNYWLACENNENLRELLHRALAAEAPA